MSPEVADTPFDRDDRSPSPTRERFVCPHCEAYASQWAAVALTARGGMQTQDLDGWSASVCLSCGNATIWRGLSMVWPNQQIGPVPHADMPEKARKIYDEARQVGNASPRSAAALLRVCLEQLVNELEPGNSRLNDKVGKLVARGLPEQVQKAMDTLRVFGNEAGAHAGELDLSDDRATVEALFEILNIVVEDVVTRQKKIEALYRRLPQGKLDAIARRDAPKA